MVRIALLVALVVGAAVRTSDACPASHNPCLKHMVRPPAMLTPTGYRRIVAGKLPRLTRASIIMFLTGADWEPLVEVPPPPPQGPAMVMPPRVRFMDPASPSLTRPRTQVRQVLIREIEFHNWHTMIGIDGEVFELARCETSRRYVCLTRLPGVTFEQLEAPADDPHFAQPPQ